MMQLRSKLQEKRTENEQGKETSTSRSAVRAVRPQREKNHLPVLLLVIALAVVATVLCYRVILDRMDDGLRQTVLAELQKIYPAAHVYVGRAHLTSPEELIVSDVLVAAKGELPRRPVLSVERMVLSGDLDISHYLQQSTCVRRIDLHGVQVDAWVQSNGQWSLECLRPKEQGESPKPIPDVHLHNAIVHIHEDTTPSGDCLTIHDIEGIVGHGIVNRGSSSIEHPSAEPSKSTASTSPADYTLLKGKFTGRSSGLLRKMEVRLEVDLAKHTARASGSIVELDFSPKLIEQAPLEVRKYLRQLTGLECRASSTFEVNKVEAGKVEFSLRGNIASGRLQDPRLPYPLDNLSGEFFCNNGLLQLRSMKARSGGAQLKLDTDIRGFTLDSPMTIEAGIEELELDQRLYRSLPAKLQEQWDRLRLSGRVNGSVSLTFDGRNWNPSARIQCDGVSVTPWLFPFPMTNVVGEVVADDKSIRSDLLTAQAGGQNVQASMHLLREGSQWLGAFACKSGGPVSINEPLIHALTPIDKPTTGVEKFVRSLHPRGAIELISATFNRQSLDDIWHKSIDANVYGGSIHYDGFRYPIYDIRGRVFGKDDDWHIDRFEGRNDSGRILCSGAWSNVRQGSAPLRLNFECFDVPAEEELKAALPSDAQFIWDELQPTGTIDSVTATIERRSPDAHVDLRVTLREDNASNQATGRSLGLRPKSFPYRLSDVGCDITYEPGFVSIISANAVNGGSKIAITGECRPNREGRWQADVRFLPTTKLTVDQELLTALPKSIRESLVKLDFSGTLRVHGDNQILFANAQYPELTTTWRCDLDTEGGRLGDGRNIGDLRGTVSVEGNSTGSQMNLSGALQMDSLTVRSIPVAGLRGPFALLGSNLYFGKTVSSVLPRVGQPETPPLTADALAGKLSLSGHGQLDIGKFTVEAELREANLSTLLQDVGVDRASTEAKCEATLQYSGVPWNPQTHTGSGRIQLRDAKLYQLPFMMRVLNTASVNASDDSAFQTADITFRIDGDRIPLQIACDGDVLRLRGEGWTNLRREVSLELYSYVGRRVPISAVISPMLAESRYATFMMIEVAGTLDNPIMQRRPFPQLEATLQQVFPEMAERPRLGDNLPWRNN